MIHDTLNPIYETIRILRRELPEETTLIGFAGRTLDCGDLHDCGASGTPDQGPAHALKDTRIVALFEAIIWSG